MKAALILDSRSNASDDPRLPHILAGLDRYSTPDESFNTPCIELDAQCLQRMSYSGLQLVLAFNSVQPADQSRPDVRMGSLLSPTPPPPLLPRSPISHTLAVTRSAFTAPKVARLPQRLTDRVPCQPSFSDFDRSHLFKRAKRRQPLGRWLSGLNRTKM